MKSIVKEQIQDVLKHVAIAYRDLDRPDYSFMGNSDEVVVAHRLLARKCGHDEVVDDFDNNYDVATFHTLSSTLVLVLSIVGPFAVLLTIDGAPIRNPPASIRRLPLRE